MKYKATRILSVFSIVSIATALFLSQMFVQPVLAAGQELSGDDSYSLVNPQKAEAFSGWDAIVYGYEFFAEPKKTVETQMINWVKITLLSSAFDFPLSFIGGGTFTLANFIEQMNAGEGAVVVTEEELNDDPADDAPQPSPVSFNGNYFSSLRADGRIRHIIEIDPVIMDEYASVGRTPGGLGELVTGSLAYMYEKSPVPTDMAYYINDTFDNTLMGEDVYALSLFDNTYEKGIFTIWKTVRNISVSLLSLFLGVVGLMIMFRYKINPQVVATVYNSLPYVPVGIAFIVLSYPIVNFVLSMVWPLAFFAFQLGLSVVAQFGLSGLSADPSFTEIIVWAINGLVGSVQPTSLLVVALMLVAVIMTLGGMAICLLKVLSIYIRFIWYTIVSPVVGLLFILPGNQKILTSFLIKILADVLAIPVTFLGLIVGCGIIATSILGASDGSLEALLFRGMFNVNMFAIMIRVCMGFIIMTQSIKADKIIHEALSVQKGIFYNPQPKR